MPETGLIVSNWKAKFLDEDGWKKKPSCIINVPQKQQDMKSLQNKNRSIRVEYYCRSGSRCKVVETPQTTRRNRPNTRTHTEHILTQQGTF